MDAYQAFFQGKRVLVTGHTGFKGSWLSHWLIRLGAEVHGYSLEPEPQALLFGQLQLANRMEHTIGDIRDAAGLEKYIRGIEPEIVFHLAAQSLVRRSFDVPLETFETNVLGSANVLESLRRQGKPCTVVMVTTDKCYENREWLHSYRETDPLGGHDPYSASKGCAELVTASYRRSFFGDGAPVRVASARAGNVIGGGDWAVDRILPDTVRALTKGETILVRNPASTRPWQHVLEPLSGYLHLAAVISSPASELGRRLQQSDCSFNFGPYLDSNRSVGQLVEEILRHWPGTWENLGDPNAPHEASLLNLAIDKAYHLLAWKPVWDFEQCVEKTVAWYRMVNDGGDSLTVTDGQITEYEAAAAAHGLAWAPKQPD